MLASYRRVLGRRTRSRWRCGPLLPDCQTEDNLAAKVDAVRDAGAARIDFYHYAMMPLNRLDWIRRALAAAQEPAMKVLVTGAAGHVATLALPGLAGATNCR